MTFDDANLPASVEDAQRLLQNFLRRLKRKYARLGLDAKYIYVMEYGQKHNRLHIHLVLTDGITRAEFAKLWGLGDINADALRFEKDGLAALAKYLTKELIERIDLYPRESRKLSGQWIKTIHFKFPMYYNDNNEPTCTLSFDKNGNFLPKQNTDETIVCLSKLADTHVELEIAPEELDTITAKVSPTYPEIKAYVFEHHGIKVSSLAIAQAKKKCGLEVGECYNLPSGHGRPPTNLTPEKEAAIRDAFQYYGLI